jgi:phospholipid/cholesterol/gamma-HCH transport system substrate-binding protein
VPLEFSELLRSASALINAINPADAGTVVHEAAVGLNGRSDSLRQLTESGDRLSSTLAARTEAIDRLLTNGTSLTHTVAQHRESLGQSLTDLRQVADSLRDAKGDVSVLLDRGSVLLTQVAGIVADQKSNLDCDLKVLEVLTDETSQPRRQQELSALLDIGPRAFNGVWDVRDVEPDGVWVRVGFTENTANPPPQFVPAKELPKVRTVPACSSSLRPVTVAADYVPHSGGEGGGGGAGQTGVALALAVIAGGVVIRSAGLSLRVPRPARESVA